VPVNIGFTMEDPKVAKRDYRFQAITTLSEDFTSPWTGVTHKAGAEVVLTGSVKYDQNHILQFALPNMTALFLDQAYISWAESQVLLQKEQFLDSPSKFMPAGTIHPKDDNLLFNLLEQRMVAIVFAYTALESFANESIPEDHIFRKERDDRKCIEEYTKEQTEVLSLDTKLDYVLPPIYNVRHGSNERDSLGLSNQSLLLFQSHQVASARVPSGWRVAQSD